ncbi:MAG TPA: hypothetical protein GX404_06910 [Syntrophomonadaceae bacterium]|nr:hypothetical protein [Syntrophomonadaceae bacterium]
MMNFDIPVMEPILRKEVLDHKDYLYQVKWDGVRMLTYIEDEQVVLINKRLHNRTLQYPELQQLPHYLKAPSAVLDGELVVLNHNRPDFSAIIARDRCTKSSSIAYYERVRPVHYMVFDLLFLSGKDLRAQALEKRLQELQNVLMDNPLACIVESFDQGPALFQAVQDMEMEGIVAKKRDSPYLAGKHHQAWFKIKCQRWQDCIIGGYTLRNKKVNALLLGVYREKNLAYIGRAGSGLSAEQSALLSQELPKLQTDVSPFYNYKQQQAGQFFVQPLLGARVSYLEWTEDLHLRHPVLESFLLP